jgi:predicted adenylyl cyclase CyaB
MRNLEAKFKLSDFARAYGQAEAIGFVFQGVLTQRDTFFVVPCGKLKLREQPDGAWLIHYRRAHEGELELSAYDIVAMANPEPTRAILTAALGILAEVSKERTLLLRGNVRLHLDKVDVLGQFGEIEAVLSDDDASNVHRTEIGGILDALEIRGEDLIDVSYFELMHPT